MFKKLFTAAWLALLCTFCHLAAAATNVSVTSTPSNPTAPATVTLAVSGDADGNPIMVTKVEYFNGTTSLGVSVQSPFTLTLNNLAAGTYQISVKVTTTDPANPVLQSAPLAVTVGTAPGAATAYFIHTDQLNTPRAITDGSGKLVWQWDSDPFGKDAANEQPAGQPTFTFNQRFPGQQFDRESNLHYNYFREYDPNTGRYVESDPIGLRGGPNTYGYVLGNPIRHADPLGLATANEIRVAVAMLRCAYPDEFRKKAKSIGVSPMGEGAMGYADWANNILINSDYFGDGNTAVADGKTGIFIQTIAHEMLHVNEGPVSRIISNSFRMGNPLGYFHRELDGKAEDMVTRELIGEYKNIRDRAKECKCK